MVQKDAVSVIGPRIRPHAGQKYFSVGLDAIDQPSIVKRTVQRQNIPIAAAFANFLEPTGPRGPEFFLWMKRLTHRCVCLSILSTRLHQPPSSCSCRESIDNDLRKYDARVNSVNKLHRRLRSALVPCRVCAWPSPLRMAPGCQALQSLQHGTRQTDPLPTGTRRHPTSPGCASSLPAEASCPVSISRTSTDFDV